MLLTLFSSGSEAPYHDLHWILFDFIIFRKKSRWGTTSKKIQSALKIQKCLTKVPEAEKINNVLSAFGGIKATKEENKSV